MSPVALVRLDQLGLRRAIFPYPATQTSEHAFCTNHATASTGAPVAIWRVTIGVDLVAYDQEMANVNDVEDLRRPDAEQLLHTPDPARLAYNGPDGLPRVIPIGFLWNGTAIVVCTAVTAPKVKALRERPNVALTIDTIGPPAKSLLVRGLADVEIVDGVAPEYLAAAAKSTQGAELAAFEAQVRATYKQMARITITPTWARFYDFGAGRFPTFLRRLVDSTSG